MRRSIEPLGRALAILFAAMPFAFAAIRAMRTGSDVRYVWVALVSFAGAAIVFLPGRSRGRTPPLAFALSAAVFVAATMAAVAAALVLGTRLGPGILIVAASFGMCFAAGSLLSSLVRLPRSASRA
jgi:hypothetical protein